MKVYYKKKSSKGVTLIEMLVAVIAFSMIAIAITNAFLSSVRMQRRILEEQKMLGEVSYAMEYMTRALRMAGRDRDGACIGIEENYRQIANGIRFLNYDRENCREFVLEDGIIKESFGEGPRTPLVSSGFEVTELSFQSGGTNWSSSEGKTGDQSRITITIGIKSKDFEAMGKDVSTKVQTTVTQRQLNVPTPDEIPDET